MNNCYEQTKYPGDFPEQNSEMVKILFRHQHLTGHLFRNFHPHDV
jgi:hypothetical protein